VFPSVQSQFSFAVLPDKISGLRERLAAVLLPGLNRCDGTIQKERSLLLGEAILFAPTFQHVGDGFFLHSVILLPFAEKSTIYFA